ncbi:Cytochrome b5 reductase 4 [Stagonosporopsis vannaccii]|nr:Cytochrome b5 reductase 4 [Stagonosporopsis vannaccii]
MLVAVSILAISLSILIYHHPPSTWPAYFAPAPGPTVPKQSQKPEDKHRPAIQQQAAPQGQANRDIASEEASPATTPKATASNADAPAIPSFTLEEHHSSSDSEDEDNLPPPSFPALNSAQRASNPAPPTFSMQPPAPPTTNGSMAPPAKPSTSPSLMAPPPRVSASSLRPLPTASASQGLTPSRGPAAPGLVPPRGPAPSRGPVPNRGPPTSTSSLALPPSGNPAVIKTPNARNKVQLTPGHSPLDWANLQRSSANLSGVSSLVRVTPSMLKFMNGRKDRETGKVKDAWSAYQGKVYNISPYLPYHPGGEGELRRAAGKDGTKLFMEVHPWVNWENMLGECLVGVLVSEEQAPLKSSLEDMD